MNTFNIPYIFLEQVCSMNSKIIKENIIKLFLKNNIPFILRKGESYILYINKEEYNLKNIDEVMYISKLCIVIEASYTSLAKYVVDKYLNLGYDILCFPSDISNTHAIFSNNLIRDGAICITSYYMLIEYLKYT